MEVSSHALSQGRINGLRFSGGVFTNISNEHLDYHKTFSEYRDVKKSFFDSLNKEAFALTNKDDKNGNKMLDMMQFIAEASGWSFEIMGLDTQKAENFDTFE